MFTNAAWKRETYARAHRTHNRCYHCFERNYGLFACLCQISKLPLQPHTETDAHRFACDSDKRFILGRHQHIHLPNLEQIACAFNFLFRSWDSDEVGVFVWSHFDVLYEYLLNPTTKCFHFRVMETIQFFVSIPELVADIPNWKLWHC